MMMDVDAVGGYRGLFIECAGAGAETLILVEAGDSGESIFEGITSDKVGRTSGFTKT